MEMVSFWVSGLRQWLGDCDNDKQNVEDGNGSRQSHDETVSVDATKICTNGGACHQARGKRRWHLHI